MSFDGVQPPGGPFSLSVGDTMSVYIEWSDGSDHGAQWFQANPIGNSPGKLQVTDFNKERYLKTGETTSVRYWATVSATGDGGSGLGVVLFNLTGGGNV